MNLKKVLLLFVFIIMSIFVLNIEVSAEEKIVYWDETIGMEILDSPYFGNSLGKYLINKGVSESILNSLEGIEFNDILKSKNTISNFEIMFDISKESNGLVVLGIKNNILYIQYEGTLFFNEISKGVFAEYFFNVEYINGLEYTNTSNVVDMSYMFYNMKKIVSLNISTFDTKKVTNMSYMFGEMENLTTIYVSNRWKTNAVNSYDNIFYNDYKLVGQNNTKYYDFSVKMSLNQMVNFQ